MSRAAPARILRYGTAMGKPVVNAKSSFASRILHNKDLNIPKSAYGVHLSIKFFILHLTLYSPEQRIQSNINALVVNNLATDGENIDSILSRLSKLVLKYPYDAYLHELKLLTSKEFSLSRCSELHSGEVEIIPGQPIRGFGNTEMNLLNRFVGNDKPTVLNTLSL